MELPLKSDVRISDKEYTLIANFVYEKCGINLGDNKKELVKARLAKRIRSYNFKSFREYYEYVIHDVTSSEVVEMIDAISTNVTSFFREKDHFDFMQRVAIPELIANKNSARSKKIRIWSAACSSGEEVYTILMILMESLKDFTSWDIKVLGTDISTRALACAKEGRYHFIKVKDMNPVMLSRYFKVEFEDADRYYRVIEPIRKCAFFTRLNLMEPSFPFHGQMDLIFCRNVMIYFDKETQFKVVTKLIKYLDDKGYLFIGHSESLIGMDVNLKSIQPAVFKKIKV